MSRQGLGGVVVPIPTAADQPQERNQKKVLEGLLYFLLAMRVSGHTSGVTSSNNSITGPMLEAVYGGAGILIFTFAMFYDCCTRAERLGKLTVVEGLFSGIKLQFAISYGLSFIGSLIWMTETNKTTASQNQHLIVFAQILLAGSGFITAKNGRDIVNKMKGYFRGSSAESEVNLGRSTDPFAIETSRRERQSPIREYRAQSPTSDRREEVVAVADDVAVSPSSRDGSAFPDSASREGGGSDVRNGLVGATVRMTTTTSQRLRATAGHVQESSSQTVSPAFRVPNLQGH